MIPNIYSGDITDTDGILEWMTEQVTIDTIKTSILFKPISMRFKLKKILYQQRTENIDITIVFLFSKKKPWGESTSIWYIVVPDYTISMYGSSCNSLLFGLISLLFLVSIIFLAFHLDLGIPMDRKRKQRCDNEAMKPYIEYKNGLWDSSLVLWYYLQYYIPG